MGNHFYTYVRRLLVSPKKEPITEADALRKQISELTHQLTVLNVLPGAVHYCCAPRSLTAV